MFAIRTYVHMTTLNSYKQMLSYGLYRLYIETKHNKSVFIKLKTIADNLIEKKPHELIKEIVSTFCIYLYI